MVERHLFMSVWIYRWLSIRQAYPKFDLPDLINSLPDMINVTQRYRRLLQVVRDV